MVDTVNIRVVENEKNTIAIEGIEIPKCVTPLNGKLYFVDITGKALHEYDPATHAHRIIENPDRAPGTKEYTTALGVNSDGSLIVACDSGVYFVKPDGQGTDDWQLAVPLTMKDNERVNNGVMVPCEDGKTRFLLGTCADKPDIVNGGKRPGRLMMLETGPTTGFMMQELPVGGMTLNALSGQKVGDEFLFTYADSWKDAATIYTAKYDPNPKRLSLPIEEAQQHISFRKNGTVKEAGNGRPDGTSPVLYKGMACIAVAAIDSNEIRIYPMLKPKGASETPLDSETPLAKFILPEHIKKPTMATFATEDGHTVCYITAFDNSSGKNVGKIFKLDETTTPELKEALADFTPVNNIGTYPDIAKVAIANSFVKRVQFNDTLKAAQPNNYLGL